MNLRRLIGLPFCLLPVCVAAAQGLTPEQRYAATAEWSGTLTVVEQGGYSNDCNGGERENTQQYTHRHRSTFRLRRFASPKAEAEGVFEWRGEGASFVDHLQQVSKRSSLGFADSWTEQARGTAAVNTVMLKLDVRRGEAQFWAPVFATPIKGTHSGAHVDVRTDPATSRSIEVPETINKPFEVQGAAPQFDDADLRWSPAASVALLQFTTTKDAHRMQGFTTNWSCVPYAQQGELGRHWAQLVLVPVEEDLELLVRLEGMQLSGARVAYADWLPEGVGVPYRDPRVGSWLQLTARLQQRDGRPPLAEVKQLRFELRDTSHEPGVAMNWPALPLPGDHDGPMPPDPQPDLRFDSQLGPVEETASLQTQRVQPGHDPDGAPNGTARVEAFDYGGWSDLVVIAELNDGREVTGHLDGEDDTALISLPKRSGGSLVADAWREKEKAMAADKDDSERTAVSEPGCDGDGLTLYEEYRGFMAGGRHLRTSPRKKDLMLYNACGAVAGPGIALFRRLTGLQVHAQLLEDERNYFMPDEQRFGFPTNKDTVINGNFDRGPHRVNQHRLDLLNCGDTKFRGGGTPTVDPSWNRRARPFAVKNIWVERPDAKFWREQYGVSKADQPRQFDVSLAHELLHAVGGEHHGEGAYPIKVRAVPAGDPDNLTDQPAWIQSWFGRKHFYHFLDERTGEDITVRWAAAADRMRHVLERVGPEELGLDFHTKAGVDWAVQELFVAQPSDQHSGDETCVMRYWLADAYEKTGADYTLYIVPDGTEPVGTQLCDATQGKLVNKAGRSPQPRYFDAAPGRGRCRSWVCGNDAIAPAAIEQ